MIPEKIRTEKKQLGSNEVAVMCNIYSTLTGISTGWNADFAHAWGISTRSIRNLFDRFVERDFNGERKERSDKGLTIFNSEQKRKAVFTTYNAYKRARTNEFRSAFERIEETEYRRGFNALTVDARRQFEEQAHNERIRAPFLHDELCNLLKSTRGTVSYKTLTTQMGKIVNEETIRKHVRSLEGFSIRKSKFLPLLTEYGRKARLRWAKNSGSFGNPPVYAPVLFLSCVIWTRNGLTRLF